MGASEEAQSKGQRAQRDEQSDAATDKERLRIMPCNSRNQQWCKQQNQPLFTAPPSAIPGARLLPWTKGLMPFAYF